VRIVAPPSAGARKAYFDIMTDSSARLALHWFRNDLRLADNPALLAAAEAERLVTLFIDETDSGLRARGGAARWWLHHSLARLDESLAARGGRLVIARGEARMLVPAIAGALGADLVTWSRRYGGAERDLDGAIKAGLRDAGIRAESFNNHLLHEPWQIRSKAGGPMRVFSPFWRAACAMGPPAMPLPAPARLPPPGPCPALPGESALDALALLPTGPDWAGGLRAAWVPGEAGAAARLDAFLDGGLAGYAGNRDRPDLAATSRLSPHLAFGEISPRQVWHAVEFAARAGRSPASGRDVEKFLAELGWREFSYHLLYHYPDLATANYQRKFDAFPWQEDGVALAAWRRGRTGYPIVDAGMRELWQTGTMHNRVRMIVASFLIKHLMIDWRAGEAWFWDTLCDADPASNAASWQWVAGSGADAAPYFRIFNPITQGAKFDPDGAYIRRFVPELAGLPPAFIHRPWEAPHPILAGASISLGSTYPAPIVSHERARARALAAFEAISGGTEMPA
jgi:deoxyribodipyrimidine photo-lyase